LSFRETVCLAASRQPLSGAGGQPPARVAVGVGVAVSVGVPVGPSVLVGVSVGV